MAFLPALLAYALLWLALAARYPERSLSHLVLRAGILWSAFALLSAELLGIFGGIRPFPLGLAWLLISTAAAWWGWPLKRATERLGTEIHLPRNWLDRALIVGLMMIFGITGFLGLIAPPQSVDSLSYHLTRVAHWEQQGSLDHFATGIEVQNNMGPGGEILMLHTYLLTQGDKFVHGVQWMAMVLSVIGAAVLAGKLEAGSTGKLLAAAFVASLPQGIAQASNTMTDYLAAVWTLVVAIEVVDFCLSEDWRESRGAFLFLSLGTGLAIVTKGTSLPFLAPLGIWMLVNLFRKLPLNQVLLWGVVGTILIMSMNAGYLFRNLRTYGDPFGGVVEMQQNERMGPRGVLSNALRGAAVHAGTPWLAVNQWVYDKVAAVHVKLGMDLSDPMTTGYGFFTVPRMNTREASAGNPLHALVGLIAFPVLLVSKRSLRSRGVIFGLMVVVGYLIFHTVFKWQAWITRLHMPFFVLLGPMVGFTLDTVLPQWSMRITALALIMLSWPWLLGIDSRPLVAQAGDNSEFTVFNRSREELYFVNAPSMEAPYRTLAGPVNEAGCSRIALALSGTDLEYLFWVLFSAPREGLTIKWIVAGTPSAAYEDQDFLPCAVICHFCPQDWEDVRGVPLAMDLGEYELFLDPGEG